MGRITRVAVIAGLAVLVPAGAASAGALQASSENADIRLSAGGAATKTVSCARGSIALSGAVVPASNTATVSSVPRGVRSWRFEVVSTRRSAVRLRAQLRCVRLVVPEGVGRTTVRVGTKFVRRALVPAGGSSAVRLRCQRGLVPTGFGFDHGTATGPGADVQFTSIEPVDTGFKVGMENLGQQDATVTPYARCVQQRQRGKGAQHTMRLLRKSYSGRLKRGVFRVKGACPRGYFSIEAGHKFKASGSLFELASRATGTRGGRWYFGSPSRDPQRVSAYLLCLDLRTTFR